MGKGTRKRIGLAQNFLKSRRLVRDLVAGSTIDGTDTVYEIGPGRGIITAELAQKACKVIAIEKDERLACGLRERFAGNEKVSIVRGDFLSYQINCDRYKVFANIPYNITTNVVRMIVTTSRPPTDAYLIVQRETARRLAGIARESLFSVLAKPFFTFRILRSLRRTDFVPVPNADSVLLHIEQRREPLMTRREFVGYRNFVSQGFCAWRPNLCSAYRQLCGYNRWRRIARELRFPIKATPTQLTFEQWLALYKMLRD